jgi:hypothetical protein
LVEQAVFFRRTPAPTAGAVSRPKGCMKMKNVLKMVVSICPSKPALSIVEVNIRGYSTTGVWLKFESVRYRVKFLILLSQMFASRVQRIQNYKLFDEYKVFHRSLH